MGDGDGDGDGVGGSGRGGGGGDGDGLGLGLDADAERFVVYVGSQTETQMKGGKEEDKQWYGGESKNG
uniref:Uncharacterized protein n=1 Tax=Vespula pensylvanica TaxID=30213 RepID=A0A834U3T2_VESPE|nr:hypothetical protein H0235_011983 [Vespula pensylvanica]